MKPQIPSWQSFIRDYFIYPKWQRNIVLALVLLCLLCVFIPLIYLRLYEKPSTKALIAIVQLENKLKVKTGQGPRQENGEKTDYAFLQQPANLHQEQMLFYFDPNTASAADWQQLGVREKTIHTIQNYLAKGGQFRKAEDLKKIYGLPPALAENLLPYVRIAHSQTTARQAFASNEKPAGAGANSYSFEHDNKQPIEINSADSNAFIALPGIGTRLASRIINYRDKLHGFYSVDQLGETYGLPDSTFQKIKARLRVSPVLIKKIPLNTATADELKTPLIRYNVANAIVQYRERNGPFKSLAELQKIPLIDDFLFEKIVFYLSID